MYTIFNIIDYEWLTANILPRLDIIFYLLIKRYLMLKIGGITQLLNRLLLVDST